MRISDMRDPDWNRISCLFDAELRTVHKEDRKGAMLIPLFLDEIMRECCSKEVRVAFGLALRKSRELELIDANV